MRIAIIKLSAMGDIIHAMVALQYIKKSNPSIKIDWFVEKAFAQVLEHNPHIDNIIPINLKAIKKSKMALFEQIALIKSHSKNSYDLVIDAQGLIKSALVTRLLGKKRAGFSKSSTREGIASLFYQKKVVIDYGANAIDRNVQVLAEPLDLKITKEDILNKVPFLFFNKPDESLFTYFSHEKKNVIFVIGASWPSKMYAKERFAKLANILDANCMIVWGSEEEKKIAQEIASNSNAIVLPKANLNSLKAVIAKCDLVIGNDTGPTHMAWALNIPSITLFGCTPGYRNTYITNINKVIESNSIVDPLKLNRNDFSIQEIHEEEIAKIATQLLA